MSSSWMAMASRRTEDKRRTGERPGRSAYAALASEQVAAAGEAAPQVFRWRSSLILPVLVLASLAGSALLLTAKMRLRASLQGPAELWARACGLEHGAERPGHELQRVRDVTSADACLDLCKRERRCSAWSWGSARGVPEVTDVCTLKELSEEQLSKRQRHPGVVSGIPCRGPDVHEPGNVSKKTLGTVGTFVIQLDATEVVAGPPSPSPPKSQPALLASLFCFSLMLPNSADKALLAMQYRQHAGAFGCEESVVYSNVSLRVAVGLNASALNIGPINTLQSTTVFFALWTMIIRKGRFRFHDWTVKVDPACVFFAYRLRKALPQPNKDQGSYVKNCPHGPGGGFQALSRKAVRSLAEGASRCLQRSRGACGGSCPGQEGDFIDQCLSEVLSIRRERSLGAFELGGCGRQRGWGSCTNRSVLAFSHFGEADTYLECLFKAGWRSPSGLYGGFPSSRLPRQEQTPPAAAGLLPQLFCWAFLSPSGRSEKLLLEMQHKKRLSLFGCEEYAVYSSHAFQVAPGLLTSLVHGITDSNEASSASTFEAVWRRIIDDGRFLSHAWTVKVEPDSVFMPGRLRTSLRHRGEEKRGVYLSNCRYGLRASIEVLSRNAVGTWGAGMHHCRRTFEAFCGGPCRWDEDLLLDQCLSKVLGVRKYSHQGLLADAQCEPPRGWRSCTAHSLVALHPFRDPEAYSRCLESAQHGQHRHEHLEFQQLHEESETERAAASNATHAKAE